MSSDTATRPALAGIHHFSPTVTDVEASAAWYERVLGLQRVPVPFPHHGDEDGGHAVLLMDPGVGIAIGLHHHRAGSGDRADERRTGLDHVAFGVPARTDLDAWAHRLDDLGVAHSGVIDETNPIPYSTVVFRDPDNIQLEFVFVEM
ncbi:VOC family protein [Actinomycetospora sp. OC33-EN08]|uniref:VOC family protein n=1 Tax=Actinomycetospora aurantiaca TaxID=3129233 RepID=A0ABU8MXW8_9PSEU